MSDDRTPSDAAVRSDRRRTLWIGLATAAVALGVTAAGAFAVRGHGPLGWRGGHHGGPFDPAVAKERLALVGELALDRVDATADQQTEVQRILGAAVDRLAALGDEHRTNREAFRVALAASVIDRDALEAVREAEIALADEASRTLVTALADAADVLTPDQRAELLQLAERFHR